MWGVWEPGVIGGGVDSIILCWVILPFLSRREFLWSTTIIPFAFLGHERIVNTLYNAVKPDVVAIEFTPRVALLAELMLRIRQRLNPNAPAITEVMGDIAKRSMPRSRAWTCRPSPRQ